MMINYVMTPQHQIPTSMPFHALQSVNHAMSSTRYWYNHPTAWKFYIIQERKCVTREWYMIMQRFASHKRPVEIDANTTNCKSNWAIQWNQVPHHHERESRDLVKRVDRTTCHIPYWRGWLTNHHAPNCTHISSKMLSCHVIIHCHFIKRGKCAN